MTVVTLSNFLPELVLVGAFLVVFWRYFVETNVNVSLMDLLIPFILTLVSLILLQLLGAMVLPVRWPAVREEFRRQLVTRLEGELRAVYSQIPTETAAELLRERGRVDELLASVREVRAWLDERQTASSIASLYGS